MILRSLPVILALCLPLSPSVAMAGAAVPAHAGQPEREVPSIGPDRDPPSGDSRVSEGVESLTTAGRILVNVADAMQALVQRGSEARTAPQSVADGWCDVVQCRRQSGARLLRYATSPPARG